MKVIKDKYPHIYDNLLHLEGQERLKYLRSITIYELTEGRGSIREGFCKEAFRELYKELMEIEEEDNDPWSVNV